MRTNTFRLELITPCFCAGANQAVVEIRPSSIRGQLRWWFRALGGNPQDEALIFGSAAGDSGMASRVRVAVSDLAPAAQRTPPVFSPYDPQSYVWHYASVSGDGARWQSKGSLPSGTAFKVHITWLKETPRLKTAFDEAVSVFLNLGALGLRATRGLGAFHCEHAQDLDGVISTLERKSFTVKRRSSPDDFSDFSSALKDWASWLRYKLRKEHKAKLPSPLGSSDPRQASAVHFRPIRLGNQRISWLAFEPPAERILGSESRKEAPLRKQYDFSGPAPRPEPRRRPY